MTFADPLPTSEKSTCPVTRSNLTLIAKRTRYLLLDFDGPVCAVFAGHPAKAVAAELRLLHPAAAGPDTGADPLAILRNSAELGRDDLTGLVDTALRAAELTAIRSATATPFAREVIVTAHRTGRRIAIVSNNCAAAISSYLVAHQLDRYVHPIIGRAPGDPSRMKPHPAQVHAAIHALNAVPEECAMVGDSPSDIEAANAAGIAVIGYANKPGKAHRLAAADAVITSMAQLAAVLGM